MSIKIMTQVWQDDEISDPAQTLIMLALADYANDEGVCWPAWESIAKKARCSRTTVWRIINQLIRANKIEINHRRGRNKTNTYRIIKTFHGETSQDETLSAKTFHGETKTFHPETKNVSSYETRSSRNRHEPPTVGVSDRAFPGFKSRLTPQNLFWMISERLKTAVGPAKKKLEAERDLILSGVTGINLDPPPKPNPLNPPPVSEPPPSEEEWNAGIEAIKAEVAAASTPMPNPTATRKNRTPKFTP